MSHAVHRCEQLHEALRDFAFLPSACTGGFKVDAVRFRFQWISDASISSS